MELAATRSDTGGGLVLSEHAHGQHSGKAHGPLKITDPVAFQKMLADMKAKAEEQRLLAAKREAERAKREGANYKPGASESIPARAADEVEAVGRKVDAQRDYYATLGIESCAAVAEIKAAYKKLALLYHPDKHKAEDAEQQAAIADKFREAAEAFEVLSDERSRALYDKVRDYQGANPGRGLPLLSREEAAMMASGAAELARLRRLGTKHIKHAPSARSVALPLEQLNSGCMKTVTFSRRRVDDHGIEYSSTRSFYLVIRKGSQQGDVLTFESEGDETVDTQPGDLLVTLAAEPHPRFRRSGPKDLETFCGLLPAAQFFAAVEVPTPSGAPRTLCARILPQLLASGGAGGTWVGTVRGQGLFDHDDPWGAPPGDLRACLRYPALRLRPGSVRVAARPGLLLLFGSASDPISGAALGGLLAAQLAHEALTHPSSCGPCWRRCWPGARRWPAWAEPYRSCTPPEYCPGTAHARARRTAAGAACTERRSARRCPAWAWRRGRDTASMRSRAKRTRSWPLAPTPWWRRPAGRRDRGSRRALKRTRTGGFSSPWSRGQPERAY
ncbi:hypothetical protein ACKKBF_B05240 [Auxenochlorella protothecoides x Auxenochlorella symbiontica]